MPVRKFRSVQEMNGDRWYEPGSAELFQAIRRVWALGHRTLRPRFPPGVYKHRTIDDMNALQAQWDDANFEAYRRRLTEEAESSAKSS
jgi:hypothetical protein